MAGDEVSYTLPVKPLGTKAYGSIGHLPQSRLGPGDHSVNPGQAKICLEKTRDKHDLIIVQEKLDGSCCSVARVDGVIVPLGRAGYPAESSKYEQHHLFAAWVYERQQWFLDILTDGERIVGEWLAMAHGTRYRLPHEPFVAFDMMRGHERVTLDELVARNDGRLPLPRQIHRGDPISLDLVREKLGPEYADFHGALDPIEGAVWRVERKGAVDFLAKWVRPDKVDGTYFVEPLTWNWRPATRRLSG